MFSPQFQLEQKPASDLGDAAASCLAIAAEVGPLVSFSKPPQDSPTLGMLYAPLARLNH